MGRGRQYQGMTYDYFRGCGGGRLRYGWAGVSGKGARRCLVLLNGRSEFMERYEPVVARLVQRKFHVLSMDWRGQGLSVRSLANPLKGYVEDFRVYLDDLTLFFNEKVAPLGLPVTFLAHSMGGHMALRFMEKMGTAVENAVLVSPMVDIVTWPVPRKVARHLARWAVALGRGDAYIPGRGDYQPGQVRFQGNPLTHDPGRFWQEHRIIDRNPALALGGATWQWLKAAFDSIDYLAMDHVARRITPPVLFLSAEQDRVVSRQAQEKLCRQMPRATFVSVPGARHEILNESDAVLTFFWKAFDGFV